MTKLEELKKTLHEKNASLVVRYENGEIKEYYQNRIKDIKSILKENPNALKGAIIADKVIRKSSRLYFDSSWSKRNLYRCNK